MERKAIPFLVISIVLGLALAGVLAISLTKDVRSGSLSLNISNPRGVDLGEMRKGDDIKGSFSSEEEVGVYLLTRKEAKDLREPSFYDDPFDKEPLVTGSSGTFDAVIEKDGSYELVFWNGSLSSVHDVSYRIDLGPRYRDPSMWISLLSLGSLTTVFLALFFYKNRKFKDPQGPYRTRH